MAMAETMILELRLVHDGLDCAAFERRFGRSVYEVYGKQIDQLMEQGLLRKNQDRLYLTEKAYLVSNRVFVQFMPDD
jgi:oxygen-independent coproporphyrinogen-3 oxidase